MRAWPLLLTLLLAGSACPLVAQAAVPCAEISASQRGPELRVGTELIATRDVKLRDATLARGSRVEVVQVTRKDGRTVAVDLELKDGHVLHAVDYRVVRDSFRLIPKKS